MLPARSGPLRGHLSAGRHSDRYDHRGPQVTALAIARELGIYRPGNTVLSGDELDAMSEEDLDAAVGTTTVFSRVSPADKLRIIQSLKRTGEVTAMTGDGVNDSPALKAADIGVAMGVTGTDVAKDASDMILLDDSFTTIAYAIKEGRRVYRNIQRSSSSCWWAILRRFSPCSWPPR
ncbi:MAG: HAD-IC family P-type ATPase [Evtepia gabavorous]